MYPSKLSKIPKPVLSPVDTFLKQSEEIQDEIHRLSSYCEQETSKKSRSSSKPVPDYWNAINSSLSKHNFSPIPPKPSPFLVADILIDVLTEYSSLKQELKSLKAQPRNASDPTERPEKTFNSARMRKSISEIVENEFSEPYRLTVLEEVKQIIESKSYDTILPDLVKIKQVIVRLPKVENFISFICSELIPEANESDSLDLALARFKTLIKIQKEFEFVLQENSSLKKMVEYFSKLFEVQGTENVMDSIECVFYFVHEMKDFLECSRKVLGLDTKVAPKIVLKEILNKLI